MKDNAFFKELEKRHAEGYRFDGGEIKAYRAWYRGAEHGSDEAEMDDYLEKEEVESCIETLRKAGIKSLVYLNRSAAVMENIHWLTEADCRLEGPCTIIRREERWGITEDRKVLGLRFAIG